MKSVVVYLNVQHALPACTGLSLLQDANDSVHYRYILRSFKVNLNAQKSPFKEHN